MCPKCNQAGCEDGDCMEYIVVKEVCVHEVPKHKYNQLKQELGVTRLAHLENDLIKIAYRLNRIAEEITIEAVEIDDGEY